MLNSLTTISQRHFMWKNLTTPWRKVRLRTAYLTMFLRKNVRIWYINLKFLATSCTDKWHVIQYLFHYLFWKRDLRRPEVDSWTTWALRLNYYIYAYDNLSKITETCLFYFIFLKLSTWYTLLPFLSTRKDFNNLQRT